MKPTDLKRGDACPNCGAEMHPAPVPSDKDFARFTDRENPGHLQAGADTANPDQRAELGELFACDRCGYKTRFPAEGNAGDKTGGDRSGGRARSGDRGGDSGGDNAGDNGDAGDNGGRTGGRRR